MEKKQITNCWNKSVFSAEHFVLALIKMDMSNFSIDRAEIMCNGLYGQIGSTLPFTFSQQLHPPQI